MPAASHRAPRVLLVTVMAAMFVSVVGWFVAQEVSLPVLLALVPILLAAHVMLGGILWFVLTVDEPAE